MKRVWLSKKFSYLYEGKPLSNLDFFMQSLYTHAIGHILSGASLSHKLGGLYCLYCLYETQPFKPHFRNYLSIGELRHLKDVVAMAKENDLKAATAVVKKMIEKNVFLFGFVDKSEGRIAKRVDELTVIQNACVKVAYERLLGKTQIGDCLGMDMGEKLGLYEIKKNSLDNAKARKLAIKETSTVMDVQDIKHISGSEELNGHKMKDISIDWSKQKDIFCEQTDCNQPHSQQLQEGQGLEEIDFNQPKSDENEEDFIELDELLSSF